MHMGIAHHHLLSQLLVTVPVQVLMNVFNVR